MHLFPPNEHIPGWKISFDSQEEAERVMEILEDHLKENDLLYQYRAEMKRRFEGGKK